VATFVVFLLSFALALVLTPFSGWLGWQLGLVDRPEPRRVHRGVVPRLGGLALYLAFMGGVSMVLLLPSWFPQSTDPKESIRLTGLLIGSSFAFSFGLADDRFEFGAFPQFAAQFLASLVAIASLIIIERVNNPLTDRQVIFRWYVYAPLTIFWMMGMMNTVNWLDGLDGLAAGVGAITCAVLVYHMWRTGQHSVMLLPLALLGALIGFLPWNFHPARVFMGSTGSYTLGYALGALGIMAGARMATMLLLLGLPILDVAWLIWHRWRRGRAPHRAQLDHLHFRLLGLGFSQRQIVVGYWLFSALFGALALWLPARIYKLYALVLLGLIALGILWWVERHTAVSEE